MKLATLEGEETTRPTTGKVKEGIFSAVQFELEGKRVLDLFAGSGQMALEAVSRGADSAVLIDESTDAVNIIKENAKKTGFMKQCSVSRMDYSEYLKGASGRERFDIVFLDPPYSRNMKDEILKKVAKADVLNDGAVLICETDKDEIDGDIYGLTLRKRYKYGRVIVFIFDYNGSESGGGENE